MDHFLNFSIHGIINKDKTKPASFLKETALPNSVPLTEMRGKRPIAFKRVKAVKKVASSPRPSPFYFGEPDSTLFAGRC
ncbi:hypothetical protein LIER_37478 [Lithospermum erythrorhizon]|uniref:Uncharacterized protein n=1 Tax=Lithospermum erythrorhizon TaxID=34254 RepID=A0AAV3PKV1_LITER